MSEPWAAPDVPAEVASGATVAGPVAAHRTFADRPPSTGAPALPVPLRPMSVGDVLDGSLRIVKLAPATMVTLAAVFVVPVQLLVGALTRDRLGDAGPVGTFQQVFDRDPGVAQESVGLGLFTLGFLLQGLALACVCVGTAELVSAWYVGQDRSLADLLRTIRARAVPLVVGWILVHAAELVFGVLLFVPALVPFTWYALVSPVVACERLNPWKALGRSYELTKRRFGSVLGTCLLVAAVSALLTIGLTAIGGVYADAGLPAGWVVQTALAAGSLLLTIPFAAGAATLLYLDLRVRTEGLDIELAAARRFVRAPG